MNWKTYKNGNYLVKINLSNGTKIRCTEEDEFKPSFAENMDIKICNKCDIGCPWCHEGSTPDGELADILNEQFINTLHPYQEVALGGGNVLEHPDLLTFLIKLKQLSVIPNITINQIHFEAAFDFIKALSTNELVYGIGVSLVKATPEFIEKAKQIPNLVIHVINGIFTKEQCELLKENDLKVLILGYKDLRRGTEYLSEYQEEVTINQAWLKSELQTMFNKFQVVSFDNLALEQLEVQKLLSEEEWESFYMGDDGTSTYYIDMVEHKFAKSSTASMEERYDLLDNVDDMFKIITEE